VIERAGHVGENTTTARAVVGMMNASGPPSWCDPRALEPRAGAGGDA
jgi:hypothetical protein